MDNNDYFVCYEFANSYRCKTSIIMYVFHFSSMHLGPKNTQSWRVFCLFVLSWKEMMTSEIFSRINMFLCEMLLFFEPFQSARFSNIHRLPNHSRTNDMLLSTRFLLLTRLKLNYCIWKERTCHFGLLLNLSCDDKTAGQNVPLSKLLKKKCSDEITPAVGRASPSRRREEMEPNNDLISK